MTILLSILLMIIEITSHFCLILGTYYLYKIYKHLE